MVEEVLPNLGKQAYKTPARPVLRNVNCLYIPAKDPDMMHDWFRRYFGLNRDGWTELENRTTIIFIKSEESGRMAYEGHWGDKPDCKMYMLQFRVDDVTELHRSLQEGGVKVEDLRDNGGCGREFDFYDPEGNRYCAWELPTNLWLHVEGPKAGSPHRFAVSNVFFHDITVDEYLKLVAEDSPLTSKKLQIETASMIREKDPEGLDELLRVLEQFNEHYPDKALQIVYQNLN
jgi:predicted enzyme related to lactoylglutathione lyase